MTDDWIAEFTVLGYGRNGIIEKEFMGKEFIAEGNIAYAKDENMKVDYLNNEEGMRQDFIIYTKPNNRRRFINSFSRSKNKRKTNDWCRCFSNKE